MNVFGIIGISLGIIFGLIIILIAVILSLRVKILIGYDNDGVITYQAKLLWLYLIGDKPSKFVDRLKKRLGLDILDSEELKADIEQSGFADTVSKILMLLMVFLGQLKYLFSKLRLDKLDILVVCGGDDAADAAVDYGLVCAAVYPMVSYITSNVNTKKNAEDVKIGCNFNGDSRFKFDITISIKIFHLLRVLLGALQDTAEMANKTEVLNEQRKQD